MTAKHSDPEYRRNARIIRQQVSQARKFGRAVACRRCRLDIEPEHPYDVGHIDENGGHSIANLAAEHRYRAHCPARGNRSHGGRLGAAKTNAKRGAKVKLRLPNW